MKSPANHAAKPYILIVEDDSTTLSVYQNILQSIGSKFQLKCFSDARDALYFLEKELKIHNSVYAILLDLHMPYLDGWQFLDIIMQLKEFSHSPPLIWLCSADSSSYTFKQILKQAYVERFIHKPIEWSQLNEFYEKALELSPKASNERSLNKHENSPRSLLHLMKLSHRFSQFSMMKKNPIEKVILNVRSRLELEKQICICLQKHENPIYQALILTDFFHTLEEFIIKVTGSDDPKKEALIRILSDYLEIVERLWVKNKLHRKQRSRSYYDRYRSEYQLLEFRYISR